MGSGVLSQLLPSGGASSLGDVSSLLLACLFLSSLHPAVRKSPKPARPLMDYLAAYGSASSQHRLADTPALRQLLDTAAKHAGGPLARRIKQILG